jgi:hypothetical protein
MTLDWRLAHAPSCAPRGRERKYASLSAADTRSMPPTTTTWRPTACQGKTSEPYGFTAASRALREV